MLFMMKRLGNNLSWKPRPTQDDLSLGQPWVQSALFKMLTTFLLSMKGTPFYYYGDELGYG
jgi:glycosidase